MDKLSINAKMVKGNMRSREVFHSEKSDGSSHMLVGHIDDAWKTMKRSDSQPDKFSVNLEILGNN
jgi:hypothetical protein